MIAKRLQGAVRDLDTVARLGGDEFVIYVNLDGAQEAIGLPNRIQAAIAAPLILREHGTQAVVTVSMGIAIARSGVRADALLREADQAMYQAKQRARAYHVLVDDP